MGEGTKIQWTDHTWNPWQGCQRVSPGCDNCYMFRDKKRYGQDPDTVVRSKPPTFNKPLRWNREARERGEMARVFVASWADFFSKEADEWRADAWAIIQACESLTFQILTKRHARIAACLPEDWGEGYSNVWLGVSGENQEWADRRWFELAKVPATVRFISYEPAIGPLSLARWLFLPDWLIVGGESGPGARAFDLAWAGQLVRECKALGVACFVKQVSHRPWHTASDGTLMRLTMEARAGGDISEWPASIQTREWPR